jgi:hypothetical protein
MWHWRAAHRRSRQWHGGGGRREGSGDSDVDLYDQYQLRITPQHEKEVQESAVVDLTEKGILVAT